MGENVRTGVMQGVVEVENPGASHLVLIYMRKGPLGSGPGRGCLCSVRLDHGANTMVGENLEEQGVFDTAIDDVHAFDTIAGGIER